MDAHSVPPPPPPSTPVAPWAPAGAPPRRGHALRWVGLAAALVVVLVLALFVVGRQTGTGVAGAGSVRFTDPTKHFAASFQSQPVEDDNNVTVGGVAVRDVQWSDSVGDNSSETVGYVDYPATVDFAAPNAALAGAVAGEVSNVNGSLISKTFGTYHGFHSVDSIVGVSSGYIESRAVLAGHTLYVIVTTSPTNPPALFPALAASLTILNHTS